MRKNLYTVGRRKQSIIGRNLKNCLRVVMEIE